MEDLFLFDGIGTLKLKVASQANFCKLMGYP